MNEKDAIESFNKICAQMNPDPQSNNIDDYFTMTDDKVEIVAGNADVVEPPVIDSLMIEEIE